MMQQIPSYDRFEGAILEWDVFNVANHFDAGIC
jgi:hypothetical protein